MSENQEFESLINAHNISPDFGISLPLIPVALILDKYFGIPGPEILTVLMWSGTLFAYLIFKMALLVNERSLQK